jgi:C4-type Zn-finger protein
MSAKSIAVIYVDETPDGYRARIVMGGFASSTRSCATVEGLLEHVADVVSDRRAAEEADPRAWVV